MHINLPHYIVTTSSTGTATVLISDDGETYKQMASVEKAEDALKIARALNAAVGELHVPDNLEDLRTQE